MMNEDQHRRIQLALGKRHDHTMTNEDITQEDGFRLQLESGYDHTIMNED